MGEGGEEKKVGLPLLAAALGELSGDNSPGDKEGNETSDLAEVGVTKECFRDLERTVPDFGEAIEVWEVDRSRRASPLPRPGMMGTWILSLT
jgi:hypothetical protein